MRPAHHTRRFGSFDRALSVQVLEYVSDPAAALADLHRAPPPRGPTGRLGRRLVDRVLALDLNGPVPALLVVAAHALLESGLPT